MTGERNAKVFEERKQQKCIQCKSICCCNLRPIHQVCLHRPTDLAWTKLESDGWRKCIFAGFIQFKLTSFPPFRDYLEGEYAARGIDLEDAREAELSTMMRDVKEWTRNGAVKFVSFDELGLLGGGGAMVSSLHFSLPLVS